MPYYPTTDSQGGHEYTITTRFEKWVADYLRISVLEVEELDFIDYLVYRRDAFIYKLSQTEKGQEYLDNAWRLEQTQPDKQGLRDQFGKED